MRLLLLLPLLLVAACGGEQQPADALAPPGGPLGELVVEQTAAQGEPPQRWTLVCTETGADGDHPAAEQACAQLRALDDPLAPLAPDRICTELYGGPQTARVTGTWRGAPVDLRLSREDGCAIGQWDSLGPLLPGPVGADGAPDAPQ